MPERDPQEPRIYDSPGFRLVADYDDDYVGWAEHQAWLLKHRRFDDLDLDHLIEEVEDLANRHRDRLHSHLQTLLVHLLKLAYTQGSSHPEANWRHTTLRVRLRIRVLIEDHPGLQHEPAAYLPKAYPRAMAEAQIDFDTYGDPHAPFPAECPWTLENVLDDDFFPEGSK